jgi:N-acetylglucosaminyldiphosphoundecaprenol N-acetyl-beta-D-mannosaminyltransferase
MNVPWVQKIPSQKGPWATVRTGKRSSARVLGLRVDPMMLDDAVAELHRMAELRLSGGVHLCNAWNAVLASKDADYAAMLNSGTLNLADGMSMVWASRLLGVEIPQQRIAGVDLMVETLRQGREHGLRHYLYGGEPGVAQTLAERLTKELPGLAIVGAEAPPFRPLHTQEEEEVAQRLRSSRPDLVWVGLGTPKQDIFIERFRERVEVGAWLAVGAAFDFLSGAKPMAPRWMGRCGMEWAFRLGTEPRRLWRRYLFGNAVFLVAFGRQLLTAHGEDVLRQPSDR